jgi:MATE family multidrug resistance protein
MGFTFIAMLGVNLLHYILSAHSRTKTVFYASALALPLNALGNYALMFGHFGLPALGLAGAGWSSLFAASFMFSFLLLTITKHHYAKHYHLFTRPQLNAKTLKEIIHVGLPIGISNLGEMGVFLLVTVIMGRFGAEAVAAHIVALRVAGVIYAIPLGYAQAATVRIGLAIGSKQYEQIRQVFFTSLIIAASVGVFYLSVIGLFRQEISWIFLEVDDLSQDMMVQASLFLLLLAISQPIECIGTVGSGILRGFKDTHSTMLFSLIAFWGVAFVGGNSLAFYLDMAGTGLWLGLAGGSIAFGLLVSLRLTLKWRELFPKQDVLAQTVNG